MDRASLLAITTEAYEAAVREAGAEIPAAVGEGTALVGPGSLIDSMALVSVVLDVEQRIEEAGGPAVTLMSEDALSRRKSPFRTIGSLADYAADVAGAT